MVDKFAKSSNLARPCGLGAYGAQLLQQVLRRHRLHALAEREGAFPAVHDRPPAETQALPAQPADPLFNEAV